MYGHRSFLVIGNNAAADIVSLIKGGTEILSYRLSFQQGFDKRGKASTRVYGGTINITLSQLPPQNVIEWGMRSRKYENGVVVLVDGENLPVEKIIFQNAACVEFEINYTESGDSYASTKITIQAEKLIVGNGVDFSNEWSF